MVIEFNLTESNQRHPLTSAPEPELWKDIQGFGDGYFQVSNFGRVRSLDRMYVDRAGKKKCFKGKIYSPVIKRYFNERMGDYRETCKVGLCYRSDHRKFAVSRLVYKTFMEDIEFQEDHRIILHRDGNPMNNHLSNLYLASWGDKSRETLRLGRAKPMRERAKKVRSKREVPV